MKVGDKAYWSYKDFDGNGKVLCTVTSMHEDHIVLSTDDGMTLWVDSNDIPKCVQTASPVAEEKSPFIDELYRLLSIIEEDEMIAMSCQPRISLLEYIRKVEVNIQDVIDTLEKR